MFASEDMEDVCARCKLRLSVVGFLALGIGDVSIDAMVGLCAECLGELEDMRRNAQAVTRDNALRAVTNYLDIFSDIIVSVSTDAPGGVLSVALIDGSHITIKSQGDLSALWRAADALRWQREREKR